MKMTEKTKRRLAVGGGIAICAGLIAAISLQFAKPGRMSCPERKAVWWRSLWTRPMPRKKAGMKGKAWN